MGGRGKGVWTIFDGDGPAGIAEAAGTVSVGFTDSSRARPWSLHAVDPGGHPLEWAADARGRARTFSSKEALLDFVHRNAGTPMDFQYPQGAYPEGSREAAENLQRRASLPMDGEAESENRTIADFVFGAGSVDARERAREVGRTAEWNPLDPRRSFRDVEEKLVEEFGRRLDPLEREAAWAEHRKPRPWR